MVPWMIYGANGYTGRLIAQEALRRGLAPVLAGRNAREITGLGQTLGLETRVFDLTDPTAVADQLHGMEAVLLCAGPFSATSRPVLDGCLRTGTHYLDISGEITVLEDTFGRTKEVRQSGIVALPGSSFDVVPSDCLAAMLKRALPDATHLRLASSLAVLSPAVVGPGTLKTSIEGLRLGTLVRRDGRIVQAPASVEKIPFPDGSRPALLFPGADICTAYYSTGIPNIATYTAISPRVAGLMRRDMPPPVRRLLSAVPVQAFLKGLIERAVKGPAEATHRTGQVLLWGEVTNPAGRRAAMGMTVTGVYTFVVDCALASVSALLEAHLPPGVYTPSQAFGPDFVLQVPGINVEAPTLA